MSSKKYTASRRDFLCASILAPSFAVATTTMARAQDLPDPLMNETAPSTLPDLKFVTANGTPVSLISFHGKFLLLNIWATWCAPCRTEMPTLDRLQNKLGSPHFQVVPLSIDIGGLVPVQKFYSEIGIKHLGIYLDPSGDAMQTLDLEGIPTSFLINVDGKQIARLTGAADWDSPAARAFFQQAMTTP